MNAIAARPRQQCFFFKPVLEQVIAEANASKAADRKHVRQRRYEVRRARVQLLPEGFDDLDMPLWQQKFAEVFEAVHPPESAVDWTDEEVKWLHAHLLERSIEMLKMRGNLEEKHEILQWIYEPNFRGYRDGFIEGRRVRINLYQWEIPFTFASCCRVSGLNADELREQIRAIQPQILSR